MSNIFNPNEKKRFNLDDLIPEELHERARAAGRAAREWDEEVAWRRENDPNFETWYAEECRKTREELDAITIDKTFKELDEIYQHCRGL